MNNDDDIPVLTDLIEGRVDVTLPELGLDIHEDMYIEDDDDPMINLHIEASKPPMRQRVPEVEAIDPDLEQTIRRILDEHMELAWQEIRLAIQMSKDDY